LRPAEVWLVRHGETEWSLSGQHSGRYDLPLTENGEREAVAAARLLTRVQFDHVRCSTLQRARRTCELAGYSTDAVHDPDLQEWDYGECTGFTQEQIRVNGIAIEVRINAEDPHNNFLPEGGRHVDIYQSPGGPGIRLDGIIYRGYRIPMAYDSLLVKLIVWGYEWNQTVLRLKRALNDFNIVGPKTTIPLYLSICDEPHFQQRAFDTGYLETHQEIFNYPEPVHYVIEDTVYRAQIDAPEPSPEQAAEPVGKEELLRLMEKKHLTSHEIETLGKAGVIRSPIKGKVTKVALEIGDVVLVGDILIDLEAMKMHTHIISEVDGRVSDVLVEPGDNVDVGDTLLLIHVS